jgi:hypothetical protein
LPSAELGRPLESRPLFRTIFDLEEKNMQNMQNVKTVGITPPAAIIDNAAATTATVDTKGFSKARFMVYLGALDIAMTAFKLQHSDDSGMSGAADISGADFSVSPLTLPIGVGRQPLLCDLCRPSRQETIHGPLAHLGDGAAGSFITAWVDLYGAAETPDTADRTRPDATGDRLMANTKTVRIMERVGDPSRA